MNNKINSLIFSGIVSLFLASSAYATEGKIREQAASNTSVQAAKSTAQQKLATNPAAQQQVDAAKTNVQTAKTTAQTELANNSAAQQQIDAAKTNAQTAKNNAKATVKADVQGNSHVGWGVDLGDDD